MAPYRSYNVATHDKVASYINNLHAIILFPFDIYVLADAIAPSWFKEPRPIDMFAE